MKFKLLICLILSLINLLRVNCLGEIIYALNAGGESFTDTNGIRYRRDYLTVGTASDYGKSLDIKRVPQQDKPLYQTERYSSETFGYTIPMSSNDEDYVLWLKFSEVWFNAPNLKVFDVTLNDVVVIDSLDIFDKVGRGVAHDEVIPFHIRKNKIIINGKSEPFNNEIKIEFVKTDRDNPKINAIIIMKGKPEQVPSLPEYVPESKQKWEDDETDDTDYKEDAELDEDELEQRIRRSQSMLNQNEQEEERIINRKKSNLPPPTVPKVNDPYANDETSYVIPILVAICAFIPLLFCMCKL